MHLNNGHGLVPHLLSSPPTHTDFPVRSLWALQKTFWIVNSAWQGPTYSSTSTQGLVQYWLHLGQPLGIALMA